MDEMTDYEINRRLAEIAGVEVVPWRYEPHPPYARMPGGAPYSPLTDWSQLGPLMERCTLGVVKRVDGWESLWLDGISLQHKTDPDAKRAIALAIIAAHEE